MDIIFTKHALERLEERTGMSKENFEQIYETGKILPIGEEESSKKIHELFYSHFVDQCFISIRDKNTSEIITVLPVDYHNNCAWKVDQNTQAMMKKMYSENTPIEIDSKYLQIIPGTKLSMFIISNLLFSEFTDHVEASELLNVYNGNIHRRVVKNLDRRVDDKAYDFSHFYYSFDIAIGDMSVRDCIEKIYREHTIKDYPYILFYHSRKRRRQERVFGDACIAYAIYDAKEYLHTNKSNIQSIKKMTEMI